MTTPPLRAGAAQTDITPPAGIQLAGNVSSCRPARTLLDPIYAKALVVERGDQRLCVICLDVLMLTWAYSDLIRRRVAQECGCDPDAVLVHSLQNHSSPAVGHFLLSEAAGLPAEFTWLRGGDDRYHDFAVEGAVEAARQACAALTEVEMGAGTGIEGRLAFNRRMVMRDGSIGMPLGGSPLNPQSRYLEGPVDPELGLVCFRGPSLRPVAILAHYTCHPVNVFHRPHVVSADWPGALSHELRQAHGEQCIPLVLNGACGNINPWDPYDPAYTRDHLRMGRLLAGTANQVLEKLDYAGDVDLDWRVRHLPIPYRDIAPEQLAAAQARLAQDPLPPSLPGSMVVDPDWMYAAALVDLQRTQQAQSTYDCVIQVLRLGDTAIVGVPGEPFVEGQLRLKLSSPTFPTFLAHNTYYGGYFPTREAFQRGGYETDNALCRKLVPEALDLIMDAALDLLHEVFPAA